ncbi:MAG: DUF3299 domain-containing protein [Pseudomonadota bacterium]
MFTRRAVLHSLGSVALASTSAQAAAPRDVAWDDLIPPGVPYSEIIGEGDMDVINDTWRPVYDENAIKLNEDLNGAYIRMPGYIIPLEMGSQGIIEFILVPYVGACIHVPPPPANQLVLVASRVPWRGMGLWDPLWATGELSTRLQSTNLGDIGYFLKADRLEPFEW